MLVLNEPESIWLSCSSDDEVSKSSMIDGRGSGRLARRQKRLEKLRAKEAAAREERQARKELVKVSFFTLIYPGSCSQHGYQVNENIHIALTTDSAAFARRIQLQFTGLCSMRSAAACLLFIKLLGFDRLRASCCEHLKQKNIECGCFGFPVVSLARCL